MYRPSAAQARPKRFQHLRLGQQLSSHCGRKPKQFRLERRVNEDGPAHRAVMDQSAYGIKSIFKLIFLRRGFSLPRRACVV